jgi:hypothetical protein
MSGTATVPITPSTTVKGGSQQPLWILPSSHDPRIPFACILTFYAVLGCTVLGFNRTPMQMLLTVLAGTLLDMAFHWLFCERKLLLPLSAYISTVSLGLLLNYAHNYYLLFLLVFFTIASKYVVTYRGRHIFNPSLFGVVSALYLGGGLFSSAPAYQWGGSWGMVAFMLTAALMLFVFRIGRLPLIISFLGFYALEVLVRAYVLRYHLPLETLVLGALTSARFYLFTFYMITDPRTSPNGAWKQIGWSFAIVALDLWLHTRESLSTLFYALFLVSAARWLWLHALDFIRHGLLHARAIFSRQLFLRAAVCSLLGFGGYAAYAYVIHPHLSISNPGFALVEVPEQVSGVHWEMSNVLSEVDPRVQHFAKWVMSIGDAVAVGDFDNDGLPDLFITNPLARSEDRNALYRNLGDYHFVRVDIPALREISLHPEKYGFVAGAIFVDYDNSGAQSLFLPVAYGKSHLLKNMLPVTGKAEFVDVSEQAGVSEHTTSVAATFFDYDRDGRLDLLVGNSFTPTCSIIQSLRR